MTAIEGQKIPTKHQELLAWVEEIAALTKPDAIRWCDGSDAEWTELTDHLVERGGRDAAQFGGQGELVLLPQ